MVFREVERYVAQIQVSWMFSSCVSKVNGRGDIDFGHSPKFCIIADGGGTVADATTMEFVMCASFVENMLASTCDNFE